MDVLRRLWVRLVWSMEGRSVVELLEWLGASRWGSGGDSTSDFSACSSYTVQLIFRGVGVVCKMDVDEGFGWM